MSLQQINLSNSLNNPKLTESPSISKTSPHKSGSRIILAFILLLIGLAGNVLIFSLGSFILTFFAIALTNSTDNPAFSNSIVGTAMLIVQVGFIIIYAKIISSRFQYKYMTFALVMMAVMGVITVSYFWLLNNAMQYQKQELHDTYVKSYLDPVEKIKADEISMEFHDIQSTLGQNDHEYQLFVKVPYTASEAVANIHLEDYYFAYLNMPDPVELESKECWSPVSRRRIGNVSTVIDERSKDAAIFSWSFSTQNCSLDLLVNALKSSTLTLKRENTNIDRIVKVYEIHTISPSLNEYSNITT